MMNFPGAITQQYGQSPQTQQSPSGAVAAIYGAPGVGQPQGPYPVQQYGPGSQYGSRASLNSQYAPLPSAGQYVSQGTYGPVVSQQPLPQSQQQPLIAVINPYETPANGINPAYVLPPVIGPPQPDGASPGFQVPAPPPPPPMGPVLQVAPPPPPPPPTLCGSNGLGGQEGGPPPPPPDVNSLAAALQAAKLKKKQVG
jgi:enabled protein